MENNIKLHLTRTHCECVNGVKLADDTVFQRWSCTNMAMKFHVAQRLGISVLQPLPQQ